MNKILISVYTFDAYKAMVKECQQFFEGDKCLHDSSNFVPKSTSLPKMPQARYFLFADDKRWANE